MSDNSLTTKSDRSMTAQHSSSQMNDLRVSGALIDRQAEITLRVNGVDHVGTFAWSDIYNMALVNGSRTQVFSAHIDRILELRNG